MLNKNERVSFTSIVNDQVSTESKDFKMLTRILLQFLADDMKGSQGEFFPIDTTESKTKECANFKFEVKSCVK